MHKPADVGPPRLTAVWLVAGGAGSGQADTKAAEKGGGARAGGTSRQGGGADKDEDENDEQKLLTKTAKKLVDHMMGDL